MMKARLLTIGTEITAGEVVNSNAAWVSKRLEDAGLRVYSHLTVRDQREEILEALRSVREADVLVITGGLGPTSDDMTRATVATYCGRELEFDEAVWAELQASHQARGLPVREAHRHQCYFPVGSTRLANPVGTALGFALEHQGQHLFVLPGPPRELAGMWTKDVEPRLRPLVEETSLRWVRWTCLGAPESEIAELVEGVISGRGIEVGYRAQVPYVRVKLFVDPLSDAAVIAQVEDALRPHLVGHGTQDLAEELLERWPYPELDVVDQVTRLHLINRLFDAQTAHADNGVKTPDVLFFSTHEPTTIRNGIVLNFNAEELQTELHLGGKVETDKRRLPFKLKLDSERGRRAAAEWAIWHVVKTLRTLKP